MNNDLEKCKAFLTRFIEIWTTPIHEIKDYRPYYAEEETAKLINEIKSSGVLSTVNVEVKHGHWIPERDPDENNRIQCYHCSICDDDFHYIGAFIATKYCPNCGTRMCGDSNA